MENKTETSDKRQLRHKKNCIAYPNMFRNEGYIMKSGGQNIPEDIFDKISSFQTLTCD